MKMQDNQKQTLVRFYCEAVKLQNGVPNAKCPCDYEHTIVAGSYVGCGV